VFKKILFLRTRYLVFYFLLVPIIITIFIMNNLIKLDDDPLENKIIHKNNYDLDKLDIKATKNIGQSVQSSFQCLISSEVHELYGNRYKFVSSS